MCPFDDDDPIAVKPRAIALWHEHQQVLTERDALAARVAELERQVAQHAKARFGRRSERTRTPPAAPPAPPTPPPGHGRQPQPQLEPLDTPHTLPAADRICDACGGQLEEWPGQFEESTEVDVEPRRYTLRQHRRQKYRCRCGGCVKTAPGPLKLKEANRYSIGFGVDVAADKYALHLPLERQARAMATQGLTVETQTLWDQVDSVAFWAIGAYKRLTAHVLAHDVLGADETTWRLMDTRKGAAVPTSKWWIWIARTPRAVVYHFAGSRSADAGGELLADYEGVVVCDGYIAYQTLAAAYPTLVLAHCWSHIRRDTYELEERAPGATHGLLGLIDQLFALERDVPAADLAARARVRQADAVPVLGQIAEKALELGLTTAAESRAHVIAARIAQQWDGLTRFVTDARIPIHNNLTEQSARGPVIGRHNHQGSRSERGTRVSAILYSLVETAKLCGVDPRAYLHLVVVRALRALPPLLPHEVTPALLVEHCEYTEARAVAAIAV